MWQHNINTETSKWYQKVAANVKDKPGSSRKERYLHKHSEKTIELQFSLTAHPINLSAPHLIVFYIKAISTMIRSKTLVAIKSAAVKDSVAR